MAAAAKKAKVELQPLDDRIVLKRLEAEEKTAGGIVLPDSAKEKPQRGEILAVGPGKLLESGKRATMEVKVGDIVLFGKYSGSEVKVAGEECLIVRESDLLAKL
ncbi:MAG TPA: co-chaperone GroES [Planctomycetota bacterium]|jgi:chaperonin GroES